MTPLPARLRSLAGLRPRLTLLLGLTLLPVTVLLIVSALQSHAQARHTAEDELQRTAELMAQTQAQTIGSARTLLAVLAQSPEVADALDGDGGACHARLAEVLSLHPDYQGLAVTDHTGAIVCLATNTVPTGTLASRRSFQLALTTADFAVGDYQMTKPWNVPGLGMAYPIVDDGGRARGVVAAALGLEALNQAAATVALGEDALLIMLDHDGTVLMRWPEPEGWVGQEVGHTPLGAAVRGGSGVSTITGIDGSTRVYAFLPVPGSHSSPLGLALGEPLEAVYGNADRLLVQHVLGAGLILGLALLATWLLSQPLILKPVDHLLAATRRLAGGDLTTRTEDKRAEGELGQLAAAFDQMAAQLEEREAERARLYEAEHAARQQAERAADDARRAAERTARLQSATAALSRALTWTEVAKTLVNEGSELLGVSAGAIAMLRPDGLLETVVNLGYGEALEREFGLISVEAPVPTAEAVRAQQPLYFSSAAAVAARYPHLARAQQSGAFEALASLPLTMDGKCLGVLTFSYDQPREFSPEDRAFLESLAQQGVQALERARLYAAEQEQRQAAERAVERTTRLQTVTAQLAEMQEPKQVAAVVAEQAKLATGAHAAGVWLVAAEGQALHLAHAAGYNPETVERSRVLPTTGGTALAWSATHGEALWIESQEDADRRFPTGAAIRKSSEVEGLGGAAAGGGRAAPGRHGAQLQGSARLLPGRAGLPADARTAVRPGAGARAAVRRRAGSPPRGRARRLAHRPLAVGHGRAVANPDAPGRGAGDLPAVHGDGGRRSRRGGAPGQRRRDAGSGPHRQFPAGLRAAQPAAEQQRAGGRGGAHRPGAVAGDARGIRGRVPRICRAPAADWV